jgi:hypothetical protein
MLQRQTVFFLHKIPLISSPHYTNRVSAPAVFRNAFHSLLLQWNMSKAEPILNGNPSLIEALSIPLGVRGSVVG